MELDKDDEEVLQKLCTLDREMTVLANRLVVKYAGRYVRITKGWRKGEKGAKAIIKGGTFQCGEMLFLCMAVNKKDQIINGDAWTREYRPASHFELWPQPTNSAREGEHKQ